MSFARNHFDESKRIIDAIDIYVIDRMADMLGDLRERGGRLFFLGVGGSAGNCSHAVNEFRKIVGIEAYVPTDTYPNSLPAGPGVTFYLLNLAEEYDQLAESMQPIRSEKPRPP